jgi:hypothetical protein
VSRACAVDGCDGKHVARGYCRKHYNRIWNNGHLMLREPEPFSAKYLANAITGCWDWQRAKDKDGYGKITVGRRHLRAHRHSWELVNGPMPDELLACHACDNPGCVNPAHIFPGTHKDNHDDRGRKGRTATGERGGGAKLTAEQVAVIRRTKPGAGAAKEQYGIGRSQYYRLLRHEGWANV